MNNLTQLSSFVSPYEKNFLAFLIEKNQTSISSLSSQHNEPDDLLVENIYIIDNLEIHDHTQNPIVSLALISPIQFTFAMSAIFIQIRTLQMLKRETSVNNRLMVSQAKIHIVAWPSFVVVNALVDNIYPLSEFLSPWFCTALSLIVYFTMFSMVLYSFYAAFLRYICCLHTKRVDKFGKEKVLKLIYWIFYINCFIWSLYTICTSFTLDHFPLINQCYGYSDRIFMIESSLSNMVQRHFCATTSDQGKMRNSNMYFAKQRCILID